MYSGLYADTPAIPIRIAQRTTLISLKVKAGPKVRSSDDRFGSDGDTIGATASVTGFIMIRDSTASAKRKCWVINNLGWSDRWIVNACLRLVNLRLRGDQSVAGRFLLSCARPYGLKPLRTWQSAPGRVLKRRFTNKGA